MHIDYMLVFTSGLVSCVRGLFARVPGSTLSLGSVERHVLARNEELERVES